LLFYSVPACCGYTMDNIQNEKRRILNTFHCQNTSSVIVGAYASLGQIINVYGVRPLIFCSVPAGKTKHLTPLSPAVSA
jgi:hypothetical protein